MSRFIFAAIICLEWVSDLGFACLVSDGKDNRAKNLHDPLFKMLELDEHCPSDVNELRTLLQKEGAKFAATMVANRGFHNPRLGSFSFFEMVEIEKPAHLKTAVQKDELFFGHFTALDDDNTLILAQNPHEESLMVELMAWDKVKETYNFYELIGSPLGSKWFYRGDSVDIWADTEKLHRHRPPGDRVFGNRLRCSGCHISGGPIMKELTKPHDSWWVEERPLKFGQLAPNAQVQALLEKIQSAEVLNDGVMLGLRRLQSGKAFRTKQGHSPQVALRPLFCPEEINLASALQPTDSDDGEFYVPTKFFVDERFDPQVALQVSKSFYADVLGKLHSRFPETERSDADHAWLTPVKAKSDKIAIDRLLSKGVIDAKFVMDVLAVDMTRPLFSPTRCQLLQILPSVWTADWREVFKENLRMRHLASADDLLANLQGESTIEQYRMRAQRFLSNCQRRLKTKAGVLDLVTYLGQVRSEVKSSEISQNARGQILEPGFRVIFPTFDPPSKPGQVTLNEECIPH